MKRMLAVLLTLALVVTGLFVVPASAATVVAEGIDVSYWQGPNINWNAVASHSHGDFAILRAYCYGKDSYFDINYQRAKDAGVPVGAYCYIYGTTTAAVQAEINALLSVIQGKQFEYPIYIDIEDTATYASLGRQTVTNLVNTACKMLEEAGYFAGVYTYTSFAASYINMDQLTNYTTWIADYRGYVGYGGAYAMWQYGCEGSVGGISPVDVNYSYVDFPPIMKSLGLNGFEASTAYPYDVDTYTKMLYDGENKVNVSTAFSTTASLSDTKTQGDHSLKLTFTNPNANGNGSKLAGMAVFKFTNTADLSKYDYIRFDVYFSREMTGSNGFQINFISDNTEDGYNCLKAVNNFEAGWHSFNIKRTDIGKAVSSADWSNVKKLRFAWWNYSGIREETYFLIDNVRVANDPPVVEPDPPVVEPDPPVVEPDPPVEKTDPKVEEFRELMNRLPAVEDLELRHADDIANLKDVFDSIEEDKKTQLTQEEIDYVIGAVEKINRLEYLANLGDVTEDGSIDAKDALEVLKFAVGKNMLTQKQQLAAEVVGDHAINAKDALEILKFAVGKIVKFPIEG